MSLAWRASLPGAGRFRRIAGRYPGPNVPGRCGPGNPTAAGIELETFAHLRQSLHELPDAILIFRQELSLKQRGQAEGIIKTGRTIKASEVQQQFRFLKIDVRDLPRQHGANTFSNAF